MGVISAKIDEKLTQLLFVRLKTIANYLYLNFRENHDAPTMVWSGGAVQINSKNNDLTWQDPKD